MGAVVGVWRTAGALLTALIVLTIVSATHKDGLTTRTGELNAVGDAAKVVKNTCQKPEFSIYKYISLVLKCR